MTVRLRARTASVLMFASMAGCTRGAGGDGPYAREVDDAMPRIEKATGLAFRTRPRVEERSRDEVRAFLVKKFNEETPSAEIAGESSAYKLFGLLPESLDLQKFYLSVLTEQVIGYYDPKVKVLYIVKGTDEQTVGITLTHELVHALQDQYVNLDSLQHSTTDNDRLTAIQAVIEGQAQFEQLSIMLGGSDNIALRVGGRDRIREMIRENQSAMPVFATAPMVIQETLLFPYLSGADFVQRFKSARPGANPLASLPHSTEQILHTDAFFKSPADEPTRVTLPAPRGARQLYSNDLGEFGARLLVYQHTQDQNLAARAASGWDGDQYVVVADGSGTTGIVWASVWDTTLEAAEFSDALIRATSKRTGIAETTEAAGGASFHPTGRTISIFPRVTGGRAVILYSDLPNGMSGVIDPTEIRLTTP